MMQARLSAPGESRRAFWLLHTAGWVAAGAALLLSGLSQMPPEVALLRNLAFILIGFVLSLGMRGVYRRLRHRGATLPVLGLWSGVLCIPAGAVSAAIVNPLTFARLGHDLAKLEVDYYFAGAFNFMLVFFAWSSLYFGIRHHLDLQAERERALRADALLHAARLQTLQQQLQPHFLFNTLNGVAALILDDQSQAAYRMVLRLADLLRVSLDRQLQQRVTLREELDFLHMYLDVEAVRLGDRLRLEWRVEPDVLDAVVPSFILQPLVENALKYAVAPREEGGTVQVTASRHGDLLRLKVADNGPGLPAEAQEDCAWGVGLGNTRDRLRALYPEDGRLYLNTEESGLHVVVELPFEEASGSPQPAESPAAAVDMLKERSA